MKTNENKCKNGFCPKCGYHSLTSKELKDHFKICEVSDDDFEILNKAKFNIGDIIYRQSTNSYYEVLSVYGGYNKHLNKITFNYIYDFVYDHENAEDVSYYVSEELVKLYISKNELKERLNEFYDKHPGANFCYYDSETNELVAEVRESL